MTMQLNFAIIAGAFALSFAVSKIRVRLRILEVGLRPISRSRLAMLTEIMSTKYWVFSVGSSVRHGSCVLRPHRRHIRSTRPMKKMMTSSTTSTRLQAACISEPTTKNWKISGSRSSG